MTSEVFKKQAEELARKAEEFDKQIKFNEKQRDEHIGASKFAYQAYQELLREETTPTKKSEAEQEQK